MPARPLQRGLAAIAIAAAFAVPAHATHVALAADGSWNEFTVDNSVRPSFGTQWIDFNDGSALTFDFTVAAGSVARLTIVDAAFAGDSFYVTNFGSVIGQTADVPMGTTSGDVVFDFDEALADPSYSHGVFTFAAGTYSIGGMLKQSVLDAGMPLNATNGAVSLTTVAAVPEPSTWAMFAAGLSLAGFIAGRRRL
jgi:PEP-CTERM motif